MAILGIDIGNYSVKTSENILFKSTISIDENLLNNKIQLTLNKIKYNIGCGNFDTELNKSEKTYYLPLLFAAIALSSDDEHNLISVGLPLIQFKENSDRLRTLILNNRKKNIIINNCMRNIVIDDVIVYPEGLATYCQLNEPCDCIIVDIGGRTTDIVYIIDDELVAFDTINIGMFNILCDITKYINSTYTTNLEYQNIEHMLKRKDWKINKQKVDLSFINSIYKNYYLKIKDTLNIKYSANAENLILTGGGASYLKNAFSNKFDTILLENNIFSNAIGLKIVGDNEWD